MGVVESEHTTVKEELTRYRVAEKTRANGTYSQGLGLGNWEDGAAVYRRGEDPGGGDQ